jgi:glycosyltransferase involved in cell wall biosynthesis
LNNIVPERIVTPVLYFVIPCYNEEQVLPETSGLFLAKLNSMIEAEKISPESRVMFVNDGSKDSTWDIISKFTEEDEHYAGISLSRNRGHQNALVAGLMEARLRCDITISMDCDGQDDINCAEQMVDEYLKGNEIVYGVRNDRTSDSRFKRTTAECYYSLLRGMGVDIIPNHADYRLMSSRVLDALAGYGEVNLFLRGIIPHMGFKSSIVYYSRAERIAGKTHYPLGKMISLAIDGITSFSVRPLRIITVLGAFVAFLSLIGIIYALISAATGNIVEGWTSMTCIICFVSGIQMISLGVIGEYIGKIYLETKHRPRYIIDERKNLKDVTED